MARLTQPMREYVVQRLACFAGAARVQREVKELWGIDLSLQAIAYYDPEVPSTKTPKKWVLLFEATRKAYLEAKAQVGIASERWRMERRQVLYERAEGMGAHGNIPLCLDILEQAEKAEGGQYTNRHKVTHDGQLKTTGVLVVPQGSSGDWAQRAREQQKKLEEQAAAAAEAESGG